MQEQASEPQFYTDSGKPHLGGYIIGGDDATYYPHLWEWLVRERRVQSVIDVGCGEGHAVKFFESIGCHAQGIDGVAQNTNRTVQHDYTQGPFGLQWGAFDMVWCCEFVEHIEERYIPNFLATFTIADLVLMTHAEPGQAGHHHVNCQPASYWQGVMAAIGYELDRVLTRDARNRAGLNPNPYNHFARSGLAFVRA